MTLASGRCLGARDVVVVGGGPVGIAALWFAQTCGRSAVAIDACPAPLDTIRAFLPGLVTSSGTNEWEIGGLPLDCRDATEITREDLLSYYGRVIAYGQLELACRQRVTAIIPTPDGVTISVETAEGAAHWNAKHVIVTPWFRRRALSLGAGVEVRASVGDVPIGEQVVVVGAGLTGLETCDTLIRSGIRVTLLGRRRRELPPELATLFAISGSRLLAPVSELRVARCGVVTVQMDEDAVDVPCTVAINCTGHEINRELLGMLRAHDLLSSAELDMLETFRPANLVDPFDLHAVARALPPLGDALFHGRRGVHFAGTLFHVGGIRGAGIVCSIQTARWAVEAIAGRTSGLPPPDAHLPELFLTDALGGTLIRRELQWSDALARIVPVPVPTWSRGTKVMSSESREGTPGSVLSHETRALGTAADESLTEIREACYDGLSVGELAAALECEHETLLWALAALWRGNGLTWVPPAPS